MAAGRYSYVPGRGDIVEINFDPQSGHEQMKRRPALVLSTVTFSQTTGLAIVCPITSTPREDELAVEIKRSPTLPISGFVMIEQIKSLDWNSRNAVRKGRCPRIPLNEVLAKVQGLFQ